MAVRELTVVGKPFAGKDKDGDFKWMVKQKQYEDTLFVIAENYLDSIRDDFDEGAGTAVLRPLCPQRVSPGTVPRAVGVPTGWSVAAMGFPNMDTVFTKTAIDLSLDRIAVVLDEHPHFKRLVYSSDAKDPLMLGVKIFETTLDSRVRQYISAEINNMANRVPQRTSLKAIRKQELKLLPHALLVTESHNSKRLNSRKRSSPPPQPSQSLQQEKRLKPLVTSAKRPFGR